MGSEIETLFPFHRGSIHERRWAALAARAAPVCFLALALALALLGVFFSTRLLLAVSAALNVALWLLVCSAGIFGILGLWTVHELVSTDGGTDGAESADSIMHDQVRHIIVLPSFKEDFGLLAETLRSLSEAEGSSRFWVFLAMEEREGPSGLEKVDRLLDEFKGGFEKLDATIHPANLSQLHTDGSESPEVRGKASNLKWAISKIHEQWAQEDHCSGGPVDCILTVADADCLFHPGYFRRVGAEFLSMCQCEGSQQHSTMWQAPQLPYRNYYISPTPSRVWGYISSMYEVGGTSSLCVGGHHMVFSAYSVGLQLAVDAQLWDGDIIAEDHHAFIKGFFHLAREAAITAAAASKAGEGQPPAACSCLTVRPVMLPVKSTSVVSADGQLATWVERWHQARRHAQGVAEVSYSLLAAWDMLCTLPWGFYSLHLVVAVTKVIFKPILMHLLPVCQALVMSVLTVYWLANDRAVPECPDRIWVASADGLTLLCGLAGAWALTWPVVVPMLLLAVANFLFIRVVFVWPKTAKTRHARSLWAQEDGGIAPEFMGCYVCSKALTTALLIAVDCILMPFIMVVYGFVAEIIACWSVMLHGNQFEYRSAAKLTAGPASSAGCYGAVSAPEAAVAPA